MILKCSQCNSVLLPENIKYHTAPVEGKIHNVFCDAYCSHAWYVKNTDLGNKNDNDRQTD